jgi:hypothetical protein
MCSSISFNISGVDVEIGKATVRRVPPQSVLGCVGISPLRFTVIALAEAGAAEGAGQSHLTDLGWRGDNQVLNGGMIACRSKASVKHRGRTEHDEATEKAPMHRAKCYSSFLRALRRPQLSSALNPCGASNQTKRRQKVQDAKLPRQVRKPRPRVASEMAQPPEGNEPRRALNGRGHGPAPRRHSNSRSIQD